LRHAKLSPIAWPSNYWATPVHPVPTARVRGLATTRKCQRDRWGPSPGHPRECSGPVAPRHAVPNCVAIELLGDTSPPRPNCVHARVGNHPQMPERSMVTIPRASARVQRTCCATPSCPQLRGHRTIGRHLSIPFQRRVCAGWRPPGNAREIDGGHPQGIRASAADLLRHAMLSPIAWPSNYWATQVHPAPTACMRGLATTRKCQRDRW